LQQTPHLGRRLRAGDKSVKSLVLAQPTIKPYTPGPDKRSTCEAREG